MNNSLWKNHYSLFIKITSLIVASLVIGLPINNLFKLLLIGIAVMGLLYGKLHPEKLVTAPKKLFYY
jgi:hypothetical protein